MQKQDGFTLIELIFVISIISLVLAAAGSGFGSWVSSFKLNTEIRNLYYTFLKARQMAITNQEDYGLIFDVEEGSYSLFSDSEGKIEDRKLSQGCFYKSDDIAFGGDAKMVFKPYGTAEGGHVTLTDGKNLEYAVIISGHTGRVRFEKITN